jgi:hypothetical protein
MQEQNVCHSESTPRNSLTVEISQKRAETDTDADTAALNSTARLLMRRLSEADAGSEPATVSCSLSGELQESQDTQMQQHVQNHAPLAADDATKPPTDPQPLERAQSADANSSAAVLAAMHEPPTGCSGTEASASACMDHVRADAADAGASQVFGRGALSNLRVRTRPLPVPAGSTDADSCKPQPLRCPTAEDLLHKQPDSVPCKELPQQSSLSASLGRSKGDMHANDNVYSPPDTDVYSGATERDAAPSTSGNCSTAVTLSQVGAAVTAAIDTHRVDVASGALLSPYVAMLLEHAFAIILLS